MIQAALPRRIEHDTSVEHVGDETLVYDELRHKAFCLNRTSSAVWSRCDGTHRPAEIAAAVTIELAEPVTEEIVLFALQQLYQDGLLQAAPTASSPLLSRRELMEKLGVRGLVLLPVVAAVLVPGAAQALSGGVYGSQPIQGNQARVRRSILDQEAATAPKQGSRSSDSSAP